ncbi:MAG: hypothetical protein OEW39_03100, partial [Deltaproteobacteria bacterium]|nr:hypothetical protein [Deltaproteobacteria bacterium]
MRKKRIIKAAYLPHQPEVFDCPAPNVVYVKGRRAGGTLGAVTRLIELAHEEPGSRHLWVDATQRNILRYWQRYIAPRLKGTRYRWSEKTGVLRFASGSVCDFGSAEQRERLEGFGYDYIWINEAGSVLRDESLYQNTLLPMVAESPRARFFFIGAPKGPGLFERMFQWGQASGRKGWRSFRHPSQVNPLLNADYLEGLKSTMTERAYRQEILAEFVSGEDAVFRDLSELFTALPESAPHPGAPYVIGVDLARRTDYTVAWVGRVDQQRAVACERWRGIPWQQQSGRLAALCRVYGQAPLYVDATGVGDPVCEALSALGLPVHPVVFTAQKKRQLVEHLALWIEGRRLTMIPHDPTLR